MATPTTTSLRGQQAKYFYYRTDFGNWSDPEGDYTKDVDVAGQSETAEITAITTALADVQWKTDLDLTAGETWICITYNPITDHYSARSGEYVL